MKVMRSKEENAEHIAKGVGRRDMERDEEKKKRKAEKFREKSSNSQSFATHTPTNHCGQNI